MKTQTLVVSSLLFAVSAAQAGETPLLNKSCLSDGEVTLCREVQDFNNGALALRVLVAEDSIDGRREVHVRLKSFSAETVYSSELPNYGHSRELLISSGCVEFGNYCKVFAGQAEKIFLQSQLVTRTSAEAIDVEILYGANRSKTFSFPASEF